MDKKENFKRKGRIILKDLIVLTISAFIAGFAVQKCNDKKIRNLNENIQSLENSMQSLENTIKEQGDSLTSNKNRIDTLEMKLINHGVFINKSEMKAKEIKITGTKNYKN